MKNLDISPQHLLLTNDVNEGPVFMYLDLLARNIKDAVHRVIVADISEYYIGDTTHLILEGNHRTVSHALLDKEVPCILLEDDEDLLECQRQSDEGKMCRFTHNTTDLAALVAKGVRHNKCVSYGTDIATYISKNTRNGALDLSSLPWFIRDQIPAKFF